MARVRTAYCCLLSASLLGACSHRDDATAPRFERASHPKPIGLTVPVEERQSRRLPTAEPAVVKEANQLALSGRFQSVVTTEDLAPRVRRELLAAATHRLADKLTSSDAPSLHWKSEPADDRNAKPLPAQSLPAEAPSLAPPPGEDSTW